ncbi:TerB N-terminal domain-containing protein [Desulfovibrio sp. OttesenSCG-928-G15]|nr:TerB N-terminal domain-containing protein [Desulfovibrio sp. OttesenSCG-928-G15]
MDDILSLISVFCVMWSIIGLLWPKALFFALPSKKKRLHAFFFPLFCAFSAAGIAVALQPKAGQGGGWTIAAVFCALAVFYGTRLTHESAKKAFPKPVAPKTPVHTTTEAPEQDDSGFRITISTSTSYGYGDDSSSRPKGSPATWYGPEESVEVKGLTLPGMVYVGENLPEQGGCYNDASLINPKLKVMNAEPWQHGEEMGYWSSYSRIPPQCRGAYLKWLATGRSEPEANIGYVFLFFYGLERRLFHDGRKLGLAEPEHHAIVDEVRRLLSIYGANRSFRGYASNLLAMEWVLFQSHEEIPDYINLADSYSSDPFQVQLARQVASKAPLSPSMAIQWLTLHPEFGLRTPARRCAKEFKELFAQRYTEKHGEGIVVPPNKKTLSISYHAASPSLRGLRLDFSELPDPFMLTAPLKKVHAIAEACTDELDAYSRYLGRKGSDPASLAALALLPKDLVPTAPAAGKIKETLAAVAGSGPGLLETIKLYAMLGEEEPAQIGKKDAENLAAFVEKLGFGLIPDIRYYGVRPDIQSSVVIFPHGHGVDFKPSGEFRLVGSMIRLGAMVSQSDGSVSPHEEDVLKGLVRDNRELTGIEKDSLLAYLHWSLYTPQGASGLKQKLAELDESEKTVVSRILISVAHADGYIDPKEVKQLEKLYTSLGLDKSLVVSDIHAASTDTPVTVALRDRETTHAIPQPPSAAASFVLNEELIRIREQETRQVRDVLENIFAEQIDEPAPVVTPVQAMQHVSPLSGLDQAHQALFNRLVKQAHWERSTVYEICKELGLMLDGAMEVLNEWAFDNVNAPLLDDGDPIYFDTELAKEIVDA